MCSSSKSSSGRNEPVSWTRWDAEENSYVAGTILWYDNFCDAGCEWYLSGGNFNVYYVQEEFSASGLVVASQATTCME